MATVPCLLRWETFFITGSYSNAAFSVDLPGTSTPTASCLTVNLVTWDDPGTQGTQSYTPVTDVRYPVTRGGQPAYFSQYFRRVDFDIPDDSKPVAPITYLDTPPYTSAEFLADVVWTPLTGPRLRTAPYYITHSTGTGGGVTGTKWLAIGPPLHVDSATFTQSYGSVTYNATWWVVDTYLDGTLYQEGCKEAKVIVNGIDHALSVTVTDLSSTTLTMAEMDGVITGSRMDWAEITAEFKLIECVGTVTVAQMADSPIEFQFTHQTYGINYVIGTNHFVPVADVALTYSEPDMTADASGSYSNNSPIDTYEFTFRNAVTNAVIYNTTQAGNSLTINIQDLVDDDVTVDVDVTVTTDYGCSDDATDGTETVTSDSFTSMAEKPHRKIYTTSKNGADVVLSGYDSGLASRSVIKTWTSANHGSVWVKSTMALRVSHDNGTNYVLVGSNDDGVTWFDMATIWNSATYRKAAACGLSDGGAASVAAKRSTSPLEIYAKVTANESDWSGSSAILVGTYSGTATQFTIRQLTESGSFDLVITNGVDKMWKSVDNGATWSAF